MAKRERGSLEETVKEGNRKESLIAIRDYLAHELEANLCNTCLNSRLRTGDTAALVLRLTKVMEEIENMPEEKDGIDELERLRRRRDKSSSAGDPADDNHKSGKRLQGGRHPRGTRSRDA